MLAFAIPFEGFESIGRRSPQVMEHFGSIESFKFAAGDLEYLGRKALGHWPLSTVSAILLLKLLINVPPPPIDLDSIYDRYQGQLS